MSDFLARMTAVAEEAVRAYPFSPGATVTLVNVSENVTFRIDDPATGERAALRVHRTEYHDAPAIESELVWLDALRADGTVEVPPIVPARDGRRVLTFDAGGEDRHVTVFRWVEGVAPDPDGDLVPQFRTLGELTARLHDHAAAWTPPPGFARPVWGYDEILGARALWGRWEDGIGLDDEGRALLTRAAAHVRERMDAHGTTPDRFGLIHGDLRLPNLLFDDDVVRVIDFDDCGRSWFMYDFGAAVSFIEDDPRLPEITAAWVEGYRAARELDPEVEAEIPTFVLARRLMLTGWVARNHEHAPEAQALGAGYTAGTCELAERVLSAAA